MKKAKGLKAADLMTTLNFKFLGWLVGWKLNRHQEKIYFVGWNVNGKIQWIKADEKGSSFYSALMDAIHENRKENLDTRLHLFAGKKVSIEFLRQS